MVDVVTVTRKGQTTIPSQIRKRLGIREGTKLLVREEGGRVVFIRLPDLLDLAGVDSKHGKIGEVMEDLDRSREMGEERYVIG